MFCALADQVIFVKQSANFESVGLVPVRIKATFVQQTA